MAGITNDILSADNVNFSGSNPTIGEVTTDGELLIGSTASPNIRVGTLISPNSSITIGYSDPDITLDVDKSTVFPWTDENSSFTAVAYNGYFCTGNHTSTLPASPAQGDVISIVRATGGGWVIQANTGQTITVGASSSSSAGTATSNSTGDSMTLVYRDTSNTWFATSVIGTWTLA